MTTAGFTPNQLDTLDKAEREVLQAFALGWSPRSPEWALALLRNMGRQLGEKAYTPAPLRKLISTLEATGFLTPMRNRVNGEVAYQVPLGIRAPAYCTLLDDEDIAHLRAALWTTESFEKQQAWNSRRVYSAEVLAGIIRLDLYTGAELRDVSRYNQRGPSHPEFSAAIGLVLHHDVHPATFFRLSPQLQRDLLIMHGDHLHSEFSLEDFPFIQIINSQFDRLNSETPTAHCFILAEHAVLAGRPADALRFIAHLRSSGPEKQNPYVVAVEAAIAVTRGDWQSAQSAFERAIKGLAPDRADQNSKASLLSPAISWLHPLALIAQQTPAHLRSALKFCQTECNDKNPETQDIWGVFVNALQMRLGERPVDFHIFRTLHSGPGDVEYEGVNFWRLLMRVWLQDEIKRSPFTNIDRQCIEQLQNRLKRCDLDWLHELLTTAVATCDGVAPSSPFFCLPLQDRWQSTLTALESLLAGVSPEAEPAARIVWRLTLDPQGHVRNIEPSEQKRGPRGWGKPREMSPKRLQDYELLQEHDVPLVRCLRPNPNDPKHPELDLPAALMALIGHPNVALEGRDDRFVQLVERNPSVVIEPAAAGVRLRLDPFPDLTQVPFYLTNSHKPGSPKVREFEERLAITVIEEGPDRLAVIRFNPTQRRVARLLGTEFKLPPAAHEALNRTVDSLANTFDIRLDKSLLANDQVTDCRLRAELSRIKDGISLRLVAAPLGPAGPRCTAGRGREQLVAIRDGSLVATRRDLLAELAQVKSIISQCAVLTRHDVEVTGDHEWRIADPGLALELLDQLPELDAIAGIDWPQGKAIAVTRASSGELHVRVQSAAEWFELQGELRIDERMILDIGQLLQATQRTTGRFVEMEEGKFLALTADLAARLRDLSAIADVHKSSARVPLLAATWLKETCDGLHLDSDAGYAERLATLAKCQDQIPVVPATLNATLRPYQHEGFVWAMRLAQAGFGACLADDMGLGKTIQSLAVLLARAADGPALVVVPTSVIGNWMAEASRFAPALIFHIYGDDLGGRDRILSTAGPYDVVLTSYGMMQRDAEEFAKYTWNTAILDEGQAIKNASAFRSKAAFDLRAEFRMALSGTPIENRLGELWSLMRFCNPGLLGSLQRFNERFAAPIERKRDANAEARLRRLISPFILRRMKESVEADLPPMTVKVLSVAPDDAEAAHYEAMRRQAQQAALMPPEPGKAGQAHLHLLAQLTRLRRAACDPRLVNDGFTTRGAKVQAFMDLVEELIASGHKALVFSQFVDFLQLLREPLDEAGIRYQYLDGATSQKDRTARVAAFQNGDGDLFLISLKAGGTGLNLTAANYVVIADPWWNPAVEDQAADRAYRPGQDKPVTVYRLVREGTIEERIMTLHANKRALADAVLDGGSGAAAPSLDDLKALLLD